MTQIKLEIVFYLKKKKKRKFLIVNKKCEMSTYKKILYLISLFDIINNNWNN